jgi:predicted AlkP superfamily pyrophosphatase or phosphodiesterase
VRLERLVGDGLRRIDGIAAVYFRRDIMNPGNFNRPFVGYFERGYYPPRGKDFMVLPCEYCLLTSSATGTTHGTPYRYDTHVPVLFWGDGVAAKRITRPIHSVDIAPTIAKVFGITYPQSIDGIPLKEVVHR